MSHDDTPRTRDHATAPTRPDRRRRLLKWGLATFVVVALAIGGFIWWFFRDDAPDEVTIEDAVSQVDGTLSVTTDSAGSGGTSPAAIDADTSPPTATTPGAIAGAWTVDTSIGEFSYEDSTGTFVGFRVAEDLSGVGSTTAVGRTPTVTGRLEVDGTTVTAVAIEADMAAITTNDSRRDDRVQDALETGEFPTAGSSSPSRSTSAMTLRPVAL